MDLFTTSVVVNRPSAESPQPHRGNQPIPPELLESLRGELSRVEPELSRLVQLYDELSANGSSPRARENSGLVDEHWSEAWGVPSEVDVRAAAVRLFVNERRIPGWLRSRSHACHLEASSEAEETSDDEYAMTDDCMPADHNTRPLVPNKREELVQQYGRAAAMCGDLMALCRRLEDVLDRIENLSARNAAMDFVKWETGVGLADISAAATRLRL